MRMFKIVGVLALLLLVLVACESDNEEPIASFPQSVSDLTGQMQLSYPEGWVANQGELSLNLSNNAEALANSGQNLASGQIWGSITFLGAANLAQFELEADATPREVLERIIDRSSTRFRIQSRNDYTFGNRNATIFRGNTDRDGNLTGVINAIVEVDDGYFLFAFTMLSDENEQFVDVVRQITTTLVYTPAPTETDQ